MTLENLKDFWKTIALKHKDVKQFNVGSWYDAANNTDDKYPLVFWEMPYNINYNLDIHKRLDSVLCSLSVFLYTKQDDIADSHQAISIAKEIGDAIIMKAQLEATEFKIDSINALSVREYSDDAVSGVRYDLTISMFRELCETDLPNLFNG